MAKNKEQSYFSYDSQWICSQQSWWIMRNMVRSVFVGSSLPSPFEESHHFCLFFCWKWQWHWAHSTSLNAQGQIRHLASKKEIWEVNMAVIKENLKKLQILRFFFVHLFYGNFTLRNIYLFIIWLNQIIYRKKNHSLIIVGSAFLNKSNLETPKLMLSLEK